MRTWSQEKQGQENKCLPFTLTRVQEEDVNFVVVFSFLAQHGNKLGCFGKLLLRSKGSFSMGSLAYVTVIACYRGGHCHHSYTGYILNVTQFYLNIPGGKSKTVKYV